MTTDIIIAGAFSVALELTCIIIEDRLITKITENNNKNAALIPLSGSRFKHEMCQGIFAGQIVFDGEMQQITKFSVAMNFRSTF